MKKLLEYIPLHFCVWVIVGIILQFYTKIWEFGFLKLLLILGLVIGLLFCFKQKVIRTFLAFLLFFLIGISSVYVNNDANYKNYYKSFLKDNSSTVLRVKKVLKSSIYHTKFIAEVINIDNYNVRGKVLLNVSINSIQKSIKIDDLLYARPTFFEIYTPLNPHQFDYSFYLEKQGIYQQIYLKSNEFKNIGTLEFSLIGLSAKFRNIIQESLQKHNFKNDELAVINALLLGQRQEISKELLTDYSKAGAIHILAVSGLHVGIILLILTTLFKPIERLKNGKIIKTILVVLFLWMFAFIAGLSASVVRAVTMFTFLAIGLTFKRKNVVLFSLISSLFFLLVFKPMFLFDVGFQLSYLAVFGILWVQPKLYKIWQPKNMILDKFWQLSTVSIAAQIGILPLSLFYFHQFPGLFMLSNLIIIPFLGAILIGGIIIIALASIGVLPQFLASIYGAVITLLNSFVSWISKQEQFLLSDISFSFYMMFAAYLVTVFGVLFLIDKSANKLIYFLVSFIVVQCVFLFESNQKNTKKEFIVFHKSRNSIIGNRVGEKLLINHDLDSLSISKVSALVSYRVGENLESNYKKEISNMLRFNNNTILVVDSLGIYQLKNLNNPIVLLQQSPKINLERLIKSIKPKQIIADGSNYKSYVNRWQKTSEQQKTPFYYTGKNGAYILKK